MFDEWRINFRDKGNFRNSQCEKEIIDFGIDGLGIDDNERLILSNYVNKECSTEDFRKITDKLKIERSELTKAQVKQRTKEALMRYSLLYFMFKNRLNNFPLHRKLTIGIIRMLVDCKSTSGLFKTVFDDNEYNNSFENKSGRLICDVTKENQKNDNLEINYTNIFNISLEKFLIENEGSEWEVKTSPERIKTGFYYNSVEARIDE